MAIIIHGKDIAADIIRDLASTAPMGPITLGIVLSAGNAATRSFVAIKARAAAKLGVQVVHIELGPDATTAEAAYAVEELVKNTDGVVVQLPLPEGVDLEPVLAALPPSHDVDGLNPNPFVRPPVAAAIAEVFARTNVAVANTKAVVVGLGLLVGAPAKELLEDLGASVVAVTLNEGSLASLADADIVVLGAGKPGLVRPEMLKPGAVLIDAGTSDVAGALVGDADPKCAEVASVVAPVPGGIGPIAVAMLMRNLFILKHEQEKTLSR